LALVEFLYQFELLKNNDKQFVHIFTYFSYSKKCVMYEGWNFNSGNYLFTTDTK